MQEAFTKALLVSQNCFNLKMKKQKGKKNIPMA